MKRSFRPEFLNRLDEIIFFKPLTKSDVFRIEELLLTDLKQRLRQKQIDIELSDNAKEYICEYGFDPTMGARPLKRFMQSSLETLIARKIIAEDIAPDSVITVDVKDGVLTAE